MKTKLLLSALFTFVFYLLSSQVPQGINYQAIARDGAGAILDNKTFNIELTIQTSTGTEIWKELKLVTSNQFGLVNEVLGTGTNLVVQGLASFSMIDWNAQPLFLKTRVQYPGTTWNLLGTSQLWSVPYSLVAKDLEGPVSKLGIEGTTTNGEESLFEVKNKNGEIVFAVYNEGVRVYVPDGAKGAKGGFAVSGWSYNKTVPENYLFVGPDSIRAYIWDDPLEKGAKGGFTVSGFNTSKSITNEFLNISPDSVRIYIDKAPSTKGAKGGFTVSGFGAAKGEEEEYLRVTRDSTRIYINDETTPKGAKGGFAVSGFANAKGGSANFLNVATDATEIIDPGQNRILWYPIKNAFLAGKVRIGTPDSVGENSFATGYQSKARGVYSQAMGFKAIANGDYSTAIGKNAVANKINSFALGDSARAINNESYALGRGAVASGFRSFAFGSAGKDSTGKITDVARAIGDYSFAIGQGSQAIGKGSFSVGIADTANGDYSVAIGYNTKSGGWFSTTMGNGTNANGNYSTAMGVQTVAHGGASVAMGFNTITDNPCSFAMGFFSAALGENSTALGRETTATGESSTAFGKRTKASGIASTSMGYNSTATAEYSTAMGYWAKALGYNSTSIGFFPIAGGKRSVAIGDMVTAQSFDEIVVGSYNTTYTPGSTTAWVPTDRLFVIGNGNTSESNAVTVLKNGNVGIGIDVPLVKLDVFGDIKVHGDFWAYDGIYKRVDDGQGWHNLDDDEGTDDAQWYESTATPSDNRLKKEITPIENAIEKVGKLTGITYYWNDDAKSYFSSSVDHLYAGPQSTEEETLLLREKERGKIYEQFSGQQIGLVAQEVEKVIPEVVHNNKDGYKEIFYGNLVGLLVEAVKEQQLQIESYKSQLQSLQEKVEKIEAMMTKTLVE